MTLVCHMTSVYYFNFFFKILRTSDLAIWCSIMCGKKCFFWLENLTEWFLSRLNLLLFARPCRPNWHHHIFVIVCRPTLDIIISLLLLQTHTWHYHIFVIVADPHLTLSYLWAKLGANSNISFSGNALRLSAVQLSDIGNYSCSAFNDVGIRETRVSISRCQRWLPGVVLWWTRSNKLTIDCRGVARVFGARGADSRLAPTPLPPNPQKFKNF